MGLFDFLKRAYIDDYDLENLEDLVYDDDKLTIEDNEETNQSLNDFSEEIKKNNLSISDLFEGFEFKDESKKEKSDFSGLAESTKAAQKRAKLEEEKYDHLLNSMQAQSLIRTVDKIKDDRKTVKNHNRENREIPDVTRKPKNLDLVDTKKFGVHDIELYVKNQCDIMEESAQFIENAKAEYEAVTEEFNDISLLENAPKELKERAIKAAEIVDTISVDRRIYKTMDSKLSNNAYRRLEAHESEMPTGLKLLRKQEEYFDLVRRDMQIMEGERFGLRMEAKKLVKRQLSIRKFSILGIITLGIVFLVFIIALAVMEDDNNIALFIVVLLLSAIYSVGMFAFLKYTERQVLLTEIRLNKATAMLNKIKIKYINAANTLDYEYNKFDVSSAYELEQKYHLFREMKSEQRKLVEMTSTLNAAELELESALRKIGFYDTKVWLGRVKAIINPKEMVEVRHELTVKRQKLRNQIEYNESRIDEAKSNIKNVTVSNPDFAGDALRVIEMYERRHLAK